MGFDNKMVPRQKLKGVNMSSTIWNNYKCTIGASKTAIGAVGWNVINRIVYPLTHQILVKYSYKGFSFFFIYMLLITTLKSILFFYYK